MHGVDRLFVVFTLGAVATPGCYRGAAANANGGAETDDGTAGGGGDPDAVDDGGTETGEGSDSADPLISECRTPSYEVFQRMGGACVGCHDEGTSVPLAADFASFERLVVYNADLVTLGAPDESPLLDMLRGEAPPPLNQMPPGAVSYAQLDEEGAVEIGMEELSMWIEDLEVCDLPSVDLSPRFARPILAEQIQAGLLDQLDLTIDDVDHSSRFPLDDPTFPELPSGHNSKAGAEERWLALGGGDMIRGDARSPGVNNLFVQTLGPMAQAWCRTSITLGRDALFRHAGPTSNSATEEPQIRQNIEYLFLRMLGVQATDEEVEAMYREVYLPYEASEDSQTAWVAVCSAFVRDPLWITF
ncbi:MAG: hypothetical protein ACRBN8_09675 [Nannocystales bacterium]